MENSKGHNYQQTTTKGIQWGVNANVGLQFDLPQVGVGGSGSLGANYQRSTVHTVTHEKTKKEKVEQQSHHEETLKIPPGKKVILKMTSYRVRYKLHFTTEYIQDSQIRGSTSSIGHVWFETVLHNRVRDSPATNAATARLSRGRGVRLFYSRRQLRWIADRMEVKKTIVDA